jgi:hypothetical protein
MEIYAKATFRTEAGKKKQLNRLRVYYADLCREYNIIGSNVTFKKGVDEKEKWIARIIMLRKSIDLINRKDEIRRI